MISVVEVLQAEGFLYTKRLAWAAGRAVSKEWREEHHEAPQYAMRPKTLGSTGGGPAHMKAVYPDDWRPRIVAILRRYADEAPKPERIPTKRTPAERAAPIAAWAREALTGQEQRLTWVVDLIGDVGTPDAVGDPDGYNDKRWTEAIARLQAAMRSMQQGKHGTTPFSMIVACLGTCGANEPVPHRVTLPIDPLIDVAVALKPPPYGRWRLMTATEIEHKAEPGPGLPSSYFIDGIPF